MNIVELQKINRYALIASVVFIAGELAFNWEKLGYALFLKAIALGVVLAVPITFVNIRSIRKSQQDDFSTKKKGNLIWGMIALVAGFLIFQIGSKTEVGIALGEETWPLLGFLLAFFFVSIFNVFYVCRLGTKS